MKRSSPDQPGFFDNPPAEMPAPAAPEKGYQPKIEEGVCRRCENEKQLMNGVCQACGGWEYPKEAPGKAA